MCIYIIFILIVFLLEFTDKVLFKPVKYTYLDIDYKKNRNYKIKKINSFNNRLTLIMILSLIIIWGFSAFRYNIGWDYQAYYNTIKYGIETNIVSNNEYITIFLVKLAQNLKITNIYFVINSFICIFFIGKTVRKYSRDFWVSIVFFICFPLFFLNSLSVIRIFSAIAITFYGLRYIKENKFYKYLLIVIIASLFHKSATIAIIFYFVKNIKFSRKKLIIILILLPFVGNILNTIVFKFMPKYAVYTNESSIQEGTKAIFIFMLIEVFICIFKEKLTNLNKEINLYNNIYLVGLSIYLMFSNQGTMGHRLSLYGTIYSLLLIPEILLIFKSKKDRALVKILIYTLCILMFLYTIQGGKTTYLPYKTIFNI
ncbi:EpsG family protein [Paeniclostridium sordellii]|uniref:EpsG family protein n=1 Tax=Paraclostridium sordellii TaxID=1505 RepID=UPI00214A5F86|nr:EpsG family protein [Paeniclostridium sordellii]MCR1849917.1 EpsG family protein [Paeniclostridium sordellii]